MKFFEEWAEARIGDLGQVFTGRTPSTKFSEYFGNEFFFITSFCELRIMLPPHPTQIKIATILSAYDDLIDNITLRIKILEEMAQALYREWFVHFSFPGHERAQMVDSPRGRILEGWEVKQVANIALIYRGRSYKSEDLVLRSKLIFSNPDISELEISDRGCET